MTIYRCFGRGESFLVHADSPEDARKTAVHQLSRQADAQVQWLYARIRKLLDDTEPKLVAHSTEFVHQLSELEVQLRQLLVRHALDISAE